MLLLLIYLYVYFFYLSFKWIWIYYLWLFLLLLMIMSFLSYFKVFVCAVFDGFFKKIIFMISFIRGKWKYLTKFVFYFKKNCMIFYIWKLKKQMVEMMLLPSMYLVLNIQQKQKEEIFLTLKIRLTRNYTDYRTIPQRTIQSVQFFSTKSKN